MATVGQLDAKSLPTMHRVCSRRALSFRGSLTWSRRRETTFAGLVGPEGASFLVVETADGPVAIGPSGEHRLRDGVVSGTDPLPPPPEAAAFLLRALSSMPELPTSR